MAQRILCKLSDLSLIGLRNTPIQCRHIAMSDCILLSALLFIRIMNPCLLLMCKQIPAQLFMNLLNAWKFFLIVFEKLCQGQFFSRQVSIIQDHTGYQCIQFTDLKMQPYIFQLAEFPACVLKPRCIRRCQKDRSEQNPAILLCRIPYFTGKNIRLQSINSRILPLFQFKYILQKRCLRLRKYLTTC